MVLTYGAFNFSIRYQIYHRLQCFIKDWWHLFTLAFCKSTSLIPANIPHPTYQTSHIPSILHLQHPTSWTSYISIIPHPEHLHPHHLIFPTSNISNIPHPQHPTSTSHIPNIPPTQHPTFSTYYIAKILHIRIFNHITINTFVNTCKLVFKHSFNNIWI